MKGKELVKWIEENHMEEKDIYVNGAKDYEEVSEVWESEYNDGSIILEVKKS